MRIVSDECGWRGVAVDIAVREIGWDRTLGRRSGWSSDVQNALATLGHNLAVAGALYLAIKTHEIALKAADAGWTPETDDLFWFPEEGRPHPRFRP